MNHHCIPCNLSFKSNKCLQQHLKCNRHAERINQQSPIPGRFVCGSCGKNYYHRQSLHVHKKSCVVTTPIIPTVETPAEAMQKKLVIYEKERVDHNAVIEAMKQKLDVCEKERVVQNAMQQKIDVYKKERKEMKDKIAVLLHTAANKCEDSETHQKSRDKRKNINKDVRRQVVNKQENACGMCKLALTPYFEIDHIIGLQFGGTDDETNLMALCRECHAMKSITENQCRPQIKDAIQTILREKLGIVQQI